MYPDEVLFCTPTGTWLKSGLGLVHQEGSQLTWTYIAPQLGYWVAAMSPPIPGNTEPTGLAIRVDFFWGSELSIHLNITSIGSSWCVLSEGQMVKAVLSVESSTWNFDMEARHQAWKWSCLQFHLAQTAAFRNS
jgi:hypothetical protein